MSLDDNLMIRHTGHTEKEGRKVLAEYRQHVAEQKATAHERN
ncbi:MAG TPA: hypothetical protein VKU60_08000 [Chloroflexota bacterium]|nr:hypothetical protein [Chloroflexota bacterium]